MHLSEIAFTIVLLLFVVTKIKTEFSFPESSSLQRSYSNPSYDYKYNEQIPQAKNMHQIKRLRKRLILLCLVNGGRRGRSVDQEAKFLFPTLVQQTDVSVNDHDDDDNGILSDAGGHGGVNCGNLMGSGLLNHPLLAPLGGGMAPPGGGGSSGGDGNEGTDGDNRFYNMNFRRQVLRPFYRTMRRFYRLLKR